MNTLTNEAIKSRIEALRNSHAQNKNAITSTYLVDAKALEELLSLRALLAAYDKAAKEPVAYIVQDKYERESGKAGYLSYSPASKYISDTDINAHEITCTPLFKNAPMPVVIDDVLSAAKQIVREFEEAERNRGPIRDRYINPMTRKEEINHIMVSIPKIRSLAAAILQGLEIISRDKLEHILAYAKQQKEIGAMRCSALPDDLIEIVERLLAGNSQVIPDGYCIMPLKLTADNGAKGALSGEFHISRTVTCHECGGEGCEDCNDQGSWEEEILIGWDTIKLIYQSAVDACSQPDKASL